MPQNFIACDRGQVLLMPPALVDWVPEDHLVWTVLGAVDQMDLDAFYGAYRSNGQGRGAYDPAMMVALLIYAYARGNRSSRGIERECREDVVYKLITALGVPDHSTVAEFRRGHETALAAVFTQVLGLWREAGLVTVGVIAVDGTKITASASNDSDRDYERIVCEILKEAERLDSEEDEVHGDARGDELPEHLQTAAGRKRALREAKQRLEREHSEHKDPDRPADQSGDDDDTGDGGGGELELVFDREVIERAGGRGRRRWFVEARQQVDEHHRREARPVKRSRLARLLESERRLSEQLAAEREANGLYEAYIAGGVTPSGRRFSARPAPFVSPEEPLGKINLTDPDSRTMQSRRGWVQGYNAQTVVNENHIIIAAEVTVTAADFGHLDPMVRAAERELQAIGVSDRPGIVVADAGYWNQRQMENVIDRGMPVVIPPDSNTRQGERPGWNSGLYAFMRRVIRSPEGGAIYRKRQGQIEPVYGDIKFNRKIDRFQRTGRAAVQSEWRLIAATHNLLKLHNHWITTSEASGGPEREPLRPDTQNAPRGNVTTEIFTRQPPRRGGRSSAHRSDG
jgi:transposase